MSDTNERSVASTGSVANVWIPVTERMPPQGDEVLVLVDGHRGPSWSNRYPLVAYRTFSRQWYEERHPDAEPVVGVTHWMPIPALPADDK